MNVVVGTAAHNTVIFNGALKSIVFSPYWNVPPGILKNEILPAMDVRMDKMLSLALHEGNEVLILGAWGCGVFRNDPKEIAGLFKKHLHGKYKNKFKKVVFAVMTKKEEVLKPFEEIL